MSNSMRTVQYVSRGIQTADDIHTVPHILLNNTKEELTEFSLKGTASKGASTQNVSCGTQTVDDNDIELVHLRILSQKTDEIFNHGNAKSEVCINTTTLPLNPTIDVSTLTISELNSLISDHRLLLAVTDKRLSQLRKSAKDDLAIQEIQATETTRRKICESIRIITARVTEERTKLAALSRNEEKELQDSKINEAWKNCTLPEKKREILTKKKVLKEVGLFALKTTAISCAVLGGIAVALPAIGFGALGPIAGSVAAAYQSSVGAVAAGSTFATLQSVGMVGLSAAAKGGIVAGSAAVSAATSAKKNKK